MEYDTAPEYYINGDPGPDTSVTRTFEHDIAGLTAYNPYAGQAQPIANYLADPTEEAILHMVNADPARTPTLAEFAKPDYYLEQGSATCNASVTGTQASDYPADCVSVDNGFAWDHGDYAAEINTNYVGFAGPGSSTSAWTARRLPTARTRPARTAARRSRSTAGRRAPGSTRPTSGRPRSTWSG
jgi:hypothetical protein